MKSRLQVCKYIVHFYNYLYFTLMSEAFKDFKVLTDTEYFIIKFSLNNQYPPLVWRLHDRCIYESD